MEDLLQQTLSKAGFTVWKRMDEASNSLEYLVRKDNRQMRVVLSCTALLEAQKEHPEKIVGDIANQIIDQFMSTGA